MKTTVNLVRVADYIVDTAQIFTGMSKMTAIVACKTTRIVWKTAK